MSLILTGFGVNIAGCRYDVQSCSRTTPGAECVLKSEYGRLVTDQRDIFNPLILPIDSEYVVVTAIQ